MTTPTITTLLPTYRRPHLLKRAIESVLEQDFADFQLCIYDNASGDETAAVVADYAKRDPRVRYHAHPSNLGLSGNLAYGLEQVATPYFSILSDDDMVLPGFFQVAARALDDHDDAAFVSTRVIHADEDSRVLQATDITWVRTGVQRPPDGFVALLKEGGPIWTGTMFRTSLVRKIGGLDLDTGFVGDWDLFLRLACHFPFVVEQRPGAVFFHQRDSISTQVKLDGTWPGWLKLMRNVAAEESLPEDVRNLGQRVLTEQLVTRLAGVGSGASRRGNFDDARQAADLLADRYGQRSRALKIRLLIFAFRTMPFLRRLPWVGGWRFTHVTGGKDGRPVTVSEYLANLDAQPPHRAPQ